MAVRTRCLAVDDHPTVRQGLSLLFGSTEDVELVGTKRLGSRPSPRAVAEQIERTARDAGATGFDTRYGYGLVDAAAALR